MDKRYKLLLILSFIISIVSLAISIFVLCPKIPRILSNKELQFDYIGAIIGILSFIITLVMGWNIYSTIDIKTISSNLKKTERKLGNTFERKIIRNDNRRAKDMGVLTATLMCLNSKRDETSKLITIYALYKEIMHIPESFALSFILEIVKNIISNDYLYRLIDKRRFLKEVDRDLLNKMKINLIEKYTEDNLLLNKYIELTDDAIINYY